MAFQRTTAINKMLAMTASKKVVQGGTSGGKTYGIIPILIDELLAVPRLRCTVVAETLTAVKKGAVGIFKDVMQDTGRWHEDQWFSGSPMEYRFANGSIMEFVSFDSVGKAKSAGKRDILFINEANHIPYEIADALMIRSLETWLDFNADTEFWAHTEVLIKPNSELLILTYEDNEALPEEIYEDLMFKKSQAYHDVNGDLDAKDNIKSNYHYNWWRVYGRGLIGNISEERVMPLLNWAKFIPEDAIEIPSGLDFGWHPDPTAFVRLYVKQYPDRKINDLFIEEVVYETHLSINTVKPEKANLTDILLAKGINPLHKIIAESADPRAIQDMRRAGFSIEAVKKKAVETSLRVFHDYNIYILKGSDNVHREFDSYKFDKDKITGKILGWPKDGQEDHTIDAVRYVLMSNRRWSLPAPKKDELKQAA